MVRDITPKDSGIVAGRFRTYNVAIVVGDKRMITNAWPMTHQEACTFRSKLTPRKGVSYVLVEVAIPVLFISLGRGWQPIDLFNETRWMNVDCVALTAIKENT